MSDPRRHAVLIGAEAAADPPPYEPAVLDDWAVGKLGKARASTSEAG